MTDMSPRSYLRDSSGPRAVSAGNGYRNGARHHKHGDDGDKHCSKRSNSHRSTEKDSSHHHRRKVSNPPYVDDGAERAFFELDVIEQPVRGIQLGMSVEASVMISLRLPSSGRVSTGCDVDTSQLLAVTSLVADSRDGELVPMEAGTLTGQKQYDSVHPLPSDCAEDLARSQPHRIALGYFSFPGLLIRQSGTYRIRTTLFKMGDNGASSILSTDSVPIKVERRGSGLGSQRRQQRVYG